ncbi:succinylglutamate desuccinylase/aspartoacylase family protein [bacterium]|nr:succinylglutamate desuccinylase/aspartoacylase family protein [bacterium]
MKFGKEKVNKGECKTIHLDVGALYDYTNLSIPIEVIRGKKDGPVLFVSAAIHGDEINGVEIIKRLLQYLKTKTISGSLIIVPVVNVFGFNAKSRYLPDRRDLNRSFPGSKKGSLARRIAYIFMKQVVEKCTHGIDLHTGSLHRSNLPQIRACLDHDETRRLASVFNAPVIIDSSLRDGSLREAARKKNISMLLFEGGQALRFEEDVIRVGLKGCIAVMRDIGMLRKSKKSDVKRHKKAYIAKDSFWLRAGRSGSFRTLKKLGETVSVGETLAVISDTFGNHEYEVKTDENGIIIGISNIPLVNRGDAMFHIATFENVSKVRKAIDRIEDIN